ncbi:hypothetical protein [Mongoliitalea lutea]|uniref:Uncharacterized protein n=1 Tax=Mongoliitalea lutea TaxID=849756 RepID=A0A8J3D4S5_9BACT|nr:hypothetical protein [Mongoliitalea lutea]GHB52310.1 hypothetical protein GCM10008106_36240 [Mongoliitalea lutea]
MKTSTRIIIIYFAAFFLILGGSLFYNAYKIKQLPPKAMEDLNIRFKFEFNETVGVEVDGDVSIPDTTDNMFVSPDGDVSMPSVSSKPTKNPDSSEN